MRSSTKRTTGELSKKNSRDGLPERGNRPGIMPLEANPAIPEGGTGAASWGWIVPVDQDGQRGENGSARLRGTHRPQYREWRDEENRARRFVPTDPIQVLASVLPSLAPVSSP